jgi:hypothetical protein
MLSAKSGWNWFSGSREEAKNVQKFMTDERRQTKTDSNRSPESLRWPKNKEQENNDQRSFFSPQLLFLKQLSISTGKSCYLINSLHKKRLSKAFNWSSMVKEVDNQFQNSCPFIINAYTLSIVCNMVSVCVMLGAPTPFVTNLSTWRHWTLISSWASCHCCLDSLIFWWESTDLWYCTLLSIPVKYIK